MIDQIIVFKFLKFCLVGFSGMVNDFSITWILKEKYRINKYFANSTGFVLAATSNYILNRIWTFHSENGRIATEFLSFIMISIAGLTISNLLVLFFSDKIKMNFYLSKFTAIGVVTLWNFTMNFLITFR
jgi:putative flippase GtrA